jgi:hypothetical protein
LTARNKGVVSATACKRTSEATDGPNNQPRATGRRATKHKQSFGGSLLWVCFKSKQARKQASKQASKQAKEGKQTQLNLPARRQDTSGADKGDNTTTARSPMKRMRRLLLIGMSCLLLVLPAAHPFALQQQPPSARLVRPVVCTASRSRHPLPMSQGDAEIGASSFTPDEVARMEALIRDLSLEADDATRRESVAQVLGQKLLEAPNGLESSPDRFRRLFELRLTHVGDQVRAQALADAEVRTNEADGDTQASAPEGTAKQLWALVDIMIQSKIIFKQTLGTSE